MRRERGRVSSRGKARNASGFREIRPFRVIRVSTFPLHAWHTRWRYGRSNAPMRGTGTGEFRVEGLVKGRRLPPFTKH